MKEFMTCSYCKTCWASWDEFKWDPQVYYIGKTEHEGDVLFFFIHKACGTTMAIGADRLDGYFKWLNEIFNKPDPRA